MRPRNYKEWLERRNEPEPPPKKESEWIINILYVIVFVIFLAPFVGVGGLVGHWRKAPIIGAVIGGVIGVISMMASGWVLLMRLLWYGL